MKFLRSLFKFLLVLAIIVALARIFLFQLVQTDSYAMIPNLVPGDYFVVFTKMRLGPGDVAVCHDPSDRSRLVALRIMGVPGSTFSIRRNHLILNENTIQHQVSDTLYYEDRSSAEIRDHEVIIAEEKVGGHQYNIALHERAKNSKHRLVEVKNGFYLVGDNRNRAHDSRNFGEVPISDCIGRAFLVIWTGSDSGDLKQMDRILQWIH